MIIGISGKAQSGKDTIGAIIQRLTNPGWDILEDNTWEIRKFADALKEIITILTGIPRADLEKIEVKQSTLGSEWNRSVPCNCCEECGFEKKIETTVRDFHQIIGTDAIRLYFPNAWVNALMNKYKEDNKWIVTDVRFPNEADIIRKKGGILIRVIRVTTGDISTHPTEIALDDYTEFDHIIYNHGSLEELEARLKSILKEEGIL